MDNNDIIELLDILYGMVTEAWGVPLGNDKCIIERDKAIEIINDIKANLPTAMAEPSVWSPRATSLSETPSARRRRCARAQRKSPVSWSKSRKLCVLPRHAAMR